MSLLLCASIVLGAFALVIARCGRRYPRLLYGFAPTVVAVTALVMWMLLTLLPMPTWLIVVAAVGACSLSGYHAITFTLNEWLHDVRF